MGEPDPFARGVRRARELADVGMGARGFSCARRVVLPSLSDRRRPASQAAPIVRTVAPPSLMAEPPPPYWVLISVLQSTFALSPSIAMTLHRAAYALYRSGAGESPVAGDVLTGRVRNLKQDVALGTITGPMFEAELDTAHGHGTVRFLLTRAGLELFESDEAPAEPAPHELN